ncbi:acylphosphatase [Staphylococcus kloosii]|jgi:acylphosphatase|uniref:acylphosphatase n=1 Tax=Staphylococcus kloosii TaxID=29384 RepID=UPI0018A0A229|nr:acylphosphatase [Staphylococcus kloosii]MBF7024203.1 acylphosphatase [Staphylococcus kloosii]
MQRKHIKVFGIVQGVGFRFYTERIALKYNITGTVQNVEDYVDIYAQGDEEDIAAFTEAVIKGASPSSQVDDYSIEDLDIDHDLKKFKTI